VGLNNTSTTELQERARTVSPRKMIFITGLWQFQGSKVFKKVFFVFHQVLHEIRAVFKIVHEVELFNV